MANDAGDSSWVSRANSRYRRAVFAGIAMRRVPCWSLDFEALDCDGDAAAVVEDHEIARLQGSPR
jgi:hypothetical protein